LWGGALALLGLVSVTAVLALDGFTWGVLGEVSSRSAGHELVAEQALRDVQQSEWSLQYYVPALAFGAGLAILGIVAARAGAVPPLAGYLLALGAVLVGTEGLIVSNAYYVIGSAVFLAGGVSMAVVIARMSDAQFSGGPPGPGGTA
jgi:hypothetical protein